MKFELPRRRMMARLALLVGIWIATAGAQVSCNSNGNGWFDSGDGGGNDFDATLTLRNVSGVETTDFVFGEAMRFDYEIVNLTNHRLTVRFTDAQIFDFVVLDNGNANIRWRWSDGQAFSQSATELTFEPYASRSYSVTWAGTLADGTQLPAGNYQARGSLVFDGFKTNPLATSQLGSPLEAFSVR
jgi:hypothetical protein